MDPLLAARLDALEKKIDTVYASAEKTRKYFLWTGIITLVVIILPLFFLPFALSQLLSYYGGISDLGNLGI
jgi:hypothetical protein